MAAMNVALLDEAERVRTVYVQEHAKDAAVAERKLRAISGRVAAGQTQLTDYRATLARRLRTLTACERLPEDLDAAA